MVGHRPLEASILVRIQVRQQERNAAIKSWVLRICIWYRMHMIQWISKAGLISAGAYLTLCAYFFYTQGLFGESFIAIILGIPWSFVLALIEFGGAEGSILNVLILTPILLNAILLYWLAATISSRIALRR